MKREEIVRSDRSYPDINGEGFLILTSRLDNLKEMLELKFDQIFSNQAVLTDRINKRESEIEALEAENKELESRITRLETSQATMRWLLALGVAAAGVVATIVSVVL